MYLDGGKSPVREKQKNVPKKMMEEKKQPASASQQQPKNMRPCFALINEGRCRYGLKCYFSHDESILRKDPNYLEKKRRREASFPSRDRRDMGPRRMSGGGDRDRDRDRPLPRDMPLRGRGRPPPPSREMYLADRTRTPPSRWGNEGRGRAEVREEARRDPMRRKRSFGNGGDRDLYPQRPLLEGAQSERGRFDTLQGRQIPRGRAPISPAPANTPPAEPIPHRAPQQPPQPQQVLQQAPQQAPQSETHQPREGTPVQQVIQDVYDKIDEATKLTDGGQQKSYHQPIFFPLTPIYAARYWAKHPTLSEGIFDDKRRHNVAGTCQCTGG